MWPEPVERIAAFLREAGAHGRIEELAADVDEPPGDVLLTAGFDCDGGSLVVLVPSDRVVDRDKVRRVAKCTHLRQGALAPFPYRPARVFLDRTVLLWGTAWLEAGSPRHVLAISPGQLVRLVGAETADLLVDD